MLTLSIRNQIGIGLVLVLFMIVTRGHHFASLQNLLPGASWAIFFLAGVYLRSAWPLLGFFALSWWLDFAAYTWGGTSGFCLTRLYLSIASLYLVMARWSLVCPAVPICMAYFHAAFFEYHGWFDTVRITLQWRLLFLLGPL